MEIQTNSAVLRETCAQTKKLVTRQQRYQAKLKAARHARRKEWQKRRNRDRSLSFDGRRSGAIPSGVPRLGAMNLFTNAKENLIWLQQQNSKRETAF